MAIPVWLAGVPPQTWLPSQITLFPLGFVTLLANQQLRKIWISLLPLPVALRHLTATPQGLIVPLNMDYQGIFVQQLLPSH